MVGSDEFLQSRLQCKIAREIFSSLLCLCKSGFICCWKVFHSGMSPLIVCSFTMFYIFLFMPIDNTIQKTFFEITLLLMCSAINMV